MAVPILDKIEDGYENSELHENISKLIFTEKNPKTIDSILESVNYISEHITNNTMVDAAVEPTMPISAISKMMVKKYNEKYENISEEEKSIIKSIIESDEEGKKNLYAELRNECIDLVNTRLTESDLETKEKLLQVKDKLLRLEYKEDSFITDITKVMDLKKDLNQDGE